MIINIEGMEAKLHQGLFALFSQIFDAYDYQNGLYVFLLIHCNY